MREKWLMLLVTRTRWLVIAMEATIISASEIIAPCPLSVAYRSAAVKMTSSVIGRTILTLQNNRKASICFCAFFALSPLRISYCVICEIVRRLCSRRYSDARALTELLPLKSSDSISVSRRDGGYTFSHRFLKNGFYRLLLFLYLQFLEQKGHHIP